MKNMRLWKRCSLLLVLLLLAVSAGADVVRISGSVVDDKGKAMEGVSIVDKASNKVIGTTDKDGRFAFDAMDGSTLLFSAIGYKKETARVRSGRALSIVLKESDISLKETGIVAKRIVDKIMPEPTTIEVKGNFFHVKTRVRVPKQMFATNTRLTVQPVIYDLTLNTNANMKPLAFDGKEYNLTQTRMYDFDIRKDSLSPFILVKSDSTRDSKYGDILPYSDSIYVPNVSHDFACDVYMVMEDYQKLLYRDTVTIAKGTVNPLRFLSYGFGGLTIQDPKYFPKEEVQLRAGKGEVHFVFPIGKSVMDMNNPTNQSELNKLEEQLQSVEKGKGTSLRDFQIVGTASPDGGYANNLKLAKARMKYSLDLILSRLPGELRERLKVSSDATVASWSDLIPLLRRDSLYKEADEISSVLRHYAGPERQSVAMRHLPFYKQLMEKYLPQLRRSAYSYGYSLYRKLTLDEIKQLYQADYKQLSRYEFWRLYSAERDSVKREKICVQAVEVYPSFMMAANDLSVLRLNRHYYDSRLLTPFTGEGAPVEVNVNQVVTLLEEGKFSRADSLCEVIPLNDQTKLLKAVSGALNGHYEENYATIAATGPRNEVLMLLAMKKNEDAYEKCQLLPKTDALTYYLLATCLNRMDKVFEADQNLHKAVKMDPSLLRVAQADGDINSLLENGKLKDADVDDMDTNSKEKTDEKK